MIDTSSKRDPLTSLMPSVSQEMITITLSPDVIANNILYILQTEKTGSEEDLLTSDTRLMKFFAADLNISIDQSLENQEQNRAQPCK